LTGEDEARSQHSRAFVKVSYQSWNGFDPLAVTCCSREPGVYMGKVGTGWSRTMSSQIRKQLDTFVGPKSKLTKPIRKPKATWVEPSFMAEVEFRDVTSDGLLRQSSFKGLSKGTRRT